MKLAAINLILAVLWQTPQHVAPDLQRFRYHRTVEAPTHGRACTVLDAPAYAHTRPSLADLRLFDAATEIPYALTTSQASARAGHATVLNLGLRAGHIVFDLEMPPGPYSTVTLDLTGQNFLASASVTGLDQLGTCCDGGVSLGIFTLFDLAAQHLGRSTSLALAEASFPYLHIDLAVSSAPGHPGFGATPQMVTGAEVPPSREAQTLFTAVAQTTSIVRNGQTSVATFSLPAQVPVERIAFELDPADQTNFSRTVRIVSTPAGSSKATYPEEIAGEISRVRFTSAGKLIRQQTLEIPAVLGSNSRLRTTVQVIVENGDDRPLALRAIRLEMRERKVCFDAPPGPVAMFYGDPVLPPPVYDYSRLFSPAEASQSAALGPETMNQRYVAPVEVITLTERHPELLWIALLAAVAILGTIAFRSARRVV